MIDYISLMPIVQLKQKLPPSVSERLIKDYRPHLFQGFKNKYFNKISLDNMLYTHS